MDYKQLYEQEMGVNKHLSTEILKVKNEMFNNQWFNNPGLEKYVDSQKSNLYKTIYKLEDKIDELEEEIEELEKEVSKLKKERYWNLFGWSVTALLLLASIVQTWIK